MEELHESRKFEVEREENSGTLDIWTNWKDVKMAYPLTEEPFKSASYKLEAQNNVRSEVLKMLLMLTPNPEQNFTPGMHRNVYSGSKGYRSQPAA